VPFAAGLSEHPVPAYAIGEVAGQVLEGVGRHPDLALLFVTPAHGGALEDAAAVVTEVLAPSVLIGGVSEAIVGTGREVENAPAVSLWAARLGPVAGVRVTAAATPDGVAFDGFPDEVPFEPSALILLGDPWSFPAEEFLGALHQPGLPVVGGMVSGARGRGGSRLLRDGEICTDGAVGALIGPGVAVETLVSQGCRPIGAPYVVTGGEGQLIHELAGRPPLHRLDEMAATLTQEDISLINRTGLHVGRVIDEHKATFDRGDFLVRNVMGGDRNTGSIAVNDVLEVGTTVQFHVRDAASADEDLRAMVSDRVSRAPAPDGILLFTCNGRGRGLFGTADHDAGVLAEFLGPVPAAGMFSAGELGPVGGRNFFHGFTASIALFSDRATSGGAVRNG
jgi:small ligand-binding sensory domain FIST